MKVSSVGRLGGSVVAESQSRDLAQEGGGRASDTNTTPETT